MNGIQLTLLALSLIIIGTGAYMYFVSDQPIGVVFMGTGAVIAACSTMIGVIKNKKDSGDAG